MRAKVLQFIERHELLKPNSTVLVGVSGGPDSIALLHVLLSLKDAYRLRIIAVSIDHLLRGEVSAKDLAYVQSICAAWEIECISEEVDVHAYQEKNRVGTQLAARTLRYDVFKRQMEKQQADYMALGHHGDDQIETMVMSLARTTNLSAFRGIPVKRSFSCGEIIRPLLGVSKQEIETYCLVHHLEPRIDASNQDVKYTRNDIRLNIVPKLKEKNSNLHQTMQQLSESLREDDQLLTEMAQIEMKRFVYFNKKDKIVTFSVEKFQACSVSLQRRIYRLILNYLYEELPSQLSYVHEEIFLSLFDIDTPNKKIDFPDQLTVERSYDQAIIYYEDTRQQVEAVHIVIQDIPCTQSLPNGATLSATYIEKRIAESENTYIFSRKEVSFPLHIRNRKPGDRMSWHGLHGTKKLKSAFIDEKVPRKLRDEMFVLADDNNEIMWVIHFKKAKLEKECEQGPFILLEYKE